MAWTFVFNLATVLTCAVALQVALPPEEENHLCDSYEPDSSASQCAADTLVWWLHIPKCGTSFKTTWCECAISPTRENAQHQALDDSDDFSQVVGMFREPSQRLASAFSFFKGYEETEDHLPCCLHDWGWTDEARTKARDLLKQELDIGQDEWLQSFRGCQTNMILGKGCMSQYWATDEDIAEAVERVNSFYFVGLLEEWSLSICLFNRKATGKAFVKKEQLDDGRPSSSTGSGPTAYDTKGYPTDHADEAVYAAVKKRFREELVQYGITIASCSFDAEGNPYEIPSEFYSIR